MKQKTVAGFFSGRCVRGGSAREYGITKHWPHTPGTQQAVYELLASEARREPDSGGKMPYGGCRVTNGEACAGGEKTECVVARRTRRF